MSSSKLGHKWWYLKILLVLEGFKQLKPGLSINPYENYFFHTYVCNLAGWKDASCHIYKLFLRFSLSWKEAFCKYHRLWNSFVRGMVMKDIYFSIFSCVTYQTHWICQYTSELFLIRYFGLFSGHFAWHLYVLLTHLLLSGQIYIITLSTTEIKTIFKDFVEATSWYKFSTDYKINYSSVWMKSHKLRRILSSNTK